MPDAFTLMWTHDTCRALRKHGREGEQPPVAFSGGHQSLPAWTGAQPGDDVYALHVNRYVVHVVSRMRIMDLSRGECCGPTPTHWQDSSCPGHEEWAMLGAYGCGAAPIHVDATPIRFDLPVPGDLLSRLTWRNARGKTRTLKYVTEDGRLERSVSLQGFYRLTPESAAELHELVSEASG
ncbi:hypothetical protein HUT06_01375 [Actinomadura sp. NAK00032]|uniref:hypothetical protein n=1 Tax=Actinomadura sp. NAK00032 TaxID=2742128 RepID=UPI0015912387|nr:hypothetical protein [Actinomadura sp. NAK00032]QKW32851.1 hypothetical protein HUT06_01375 [Actinomadura sp. NAK00032]